MALLTPPDFSLQQGRAFSSASGSPEKAINRSLYWPNNKALNTQQKAGKQSSLSDTKSSEEKKCQTLTAGQKCVQREAEVAQLSP